MKLHTKLLLLAAGAFLVLFKLNVQPVNQWDESRLAFNALEMWHNGFSVVTTYGEEPDHWNTKPPLMIWLQTAAMHLTGPNEWGLRLPAALATLFTAWFLYGFLRKIRVPDPWPLLAAAVFLLTPGIMRYHVARTGDYDALLILWITLGSFTYFRALETNRQRLLLRVFLFFALAVWTKGIAGLLYGPALLLFALISGKLLWLLKNRYTWYGAGILLLMIAFIYGWREIADPGYIQAMLHEEVTGRYSEVVAGYGGGPFYYLETFMDYRQYSYWMLFFLPGVFLILRNPNTRTLGLFQLLLVFTTLGILSVSSTKFNWYNAILYAPMAVVTAYPLFLIYQSIGQRVARLAIPATALLLLYPLAVVIEVNYLKIRAFEDHPVGAFLKKQAGEGTLNGLFVVKEEPWKRDWAHFHFYLKRGEYLGQDCGLVRPEELKPGTTVLIERPDLEQFDWTSFELVEKETYPNFSLYFIQTARP